MESPLSIAGERTTGIDVRSDNVMACVALANIVKSSLGPCGLDKMLVDEVGDVTITNDGATILKQIEVSHPASKVLVELSNLQDKEVGDGTTSVVIIAAELLKRAHELVKNQIHPTSIIQGYQTASKLARKFIAKTMSRKIEDLGEETLLNAAKTCMSSKIIGLHMDFFSTMCVEAMKAVKTSIPGSSKFKYPVKAVSIMKVHGKSAHESRRVNGYALFNTRAAQGMPTTVKNPKIALLEFDLRTSKLAFGIKIETNSAEKLEEMRDLEKDWTKSRIDSLIKAGANVILTTKGMDDMAMKYMIEAGVIGVRRVERKELRRIAKTTGGKIILSLADDEGEETVDPSMFGDAEEVTEEVVGDTQVLFIKGCKCTAAQTLILRGANDYMLDEIERSVHDALCIVKRSLESKRVVPGGGAVEGALSIHLEHVAEAMGAREQLAVAEFSQALLVIPKTLAINGAFDATDLVARLRAYQHEAATKEAKAHYRWMGLDLVKGSVRDNLKAGVLEPAMSKVKLIKFATEAAITILRIDDAIKMFPKEDPKNPHGDEHDGCGH